MSLEWICCWICVEVRPWPQSACSSSFFTPSASMVFLRLKLRSAIVALDWVTLYCFFVRKRRGLAGLRLVGDRGHGFHGLGARDEHHPGKDEEAAEDVLQREPLPLKEHQRQEDRKERLQEHVRGDRRRVDPFE